MSDEITTETSASDLRKMYEKAQEKLREAEKELATFRTEKRTSSVAEILKAKGAPAGAAKFYDGEVSEGAVTAWLEENKELFPVAAVTPSSDSGQATSVVDPNAAAARTVTAATASTADAGETDSVRDGTGRVVGDPAELMAILRNTPRSPEGYQTLVKLGLMPSDPNAI